MASPAEPRATILVVEDHDDSRDALAAPKHRTLEPSDSVVTDTHADLVLHGLRAADSWGGIRPH